MDLAEKIEYKKYAIEIYYDSNGNDPRKDFDHLGKMICFHSRYSLGDEKGTDPRETMTFLKNSKAIYLPLYLYDHSGLTMSTGPFSCPWDSGQVGWIYASPESVRKEFGKRITKQIKEKVLKILEAEVAEYDSYLKGEVYGYQVKNEDGEEIDSCWGFIGDPKENGLIEQAQNAVDSDMRNHGEQLELKLEETKCSTK